MNTRASTVIISAMIALGIIVILAHQNGHLPESFMWGALVGIGLLTVVVKLVRHFGK